MSFFFKLLLRIFDVAGQFDQYESARERGNGKVLEFATFKIRKSIITKMIDVRNVDKLTAARTKMKVGKLRANARNTNTDFGISI